VGFFSGRSFTAGFSAVQDAVVKLANDAALHASDFIV
jgi:hypothetical protein